MTDAFELTAEKTLVPNTMCKGEFLKSYGKRNNWTINPFLTYYDLIPPHARNLCSTWQFFQILDQLVFKERIGFSKIYKYWSQMQHRILNHCMNQDDLDIINHLFEQHTFHPALYPTWFLKNSFAPSLKVLPYQWQPLEHYIFEKNKITMDTSGLTSIDKLDVLNHDFNDSNALDKHIDSSKLTLIIVNNMNAYWLDKRITLNAGLMDSQSLAMHPITLFLKKTILEIWQDKKIDTLSISTKQYSQETSLNLISRLTQQTFNDIETIIINRFLSLLNDYSDLNTYFVSEHHRIFFSWIDVHQVNIYINQPNVMITTPKHAFPHMYDECIIVNLDDEALNKLYFSNNQTIKKLQTNNNHDIFKAKSNYINQTNFSLNETTLNVTDFAKFQRCPIIYTCQNKLKIKNEQSSILKMQIGIVIHAVLADFWSLIKDQTTLKKHQPNQIKQIVSEFVITHIEKINISHTMDQHYWHFQKKHLTDKILKWVMFEMERTPFKVVAIEKDIHLQCQNKFIKGRVDRVDYIENLGYVVIDYKTGASQSISASLNGFPDPQMLIYTKALEYDVVGFAYGMIATTQLKGLQFQDSDNDVLPFFDKPLIDEILKKHSELFDAILKPLPLEPRQCLRCDFQSVCHDASTSK